MMSLLTGRRILLGVTGGIAAYKAVYLTREIVRAGGEVRVLMSAAAKKFVAPLTFSTLTGHPVLDEMFPDPAPVDPVHLLPGQWGDIFVIAPATADFIGKVANGLANDIPSAAAMAFRGPILLAPAMNPRMWNNSAVQDNVARLRLRGLHFIGPERGDMGGVHEQAGVGRMSEPAAIFDHIEELLYPDKCWMNRRVVVTAGATCEPFDPVRFISNRSSGKMGDAVARQARLMGAEVFLIRTNSAIGEPPSGVEIIKVDTAAEMADAVKALFPTADLLIMVAAVADWRAKTASAGKIKKHTGILTLELEPTEDILLWAGKNRQEQVIVGFALETDDHIVNARRKLEDKNVDIIALNDPTSADSVFGGDSIRLTILKTYCEPLELPAMSKREAAARLLSEAYGYLK